jgi:protein-arginine kinase activator protein McsA
MKCDFCDNLATVHVTEVKHGKPVDVHACHRCGWQKLGVEIPAEAEPILGISQNVVAKFASWSTVAVWAK